MRIIENMRKLIVRHTAVFIAFMLLMVISVSSLLFTFNFVANVMTNNGISPFDDDAGRYLLEGGIISAFMLMSVFNLAYVYSYVLDTRRREIAINRISGQSILSCIGVFYLEMLIMSTIGYIISLAATKLVILPLMRGGGFMFADSLNISQCAFLYLILILIYSTVFLPSIAAEVRKSPSEALTEGG